MGQNVRVPSNSCSHFDVSKPEKRWPNADFRSRTFPHTQIGAAEAIVPAQLVDVDECPHEAHAERKRREIETEYAIAPLPQGGRFPLEGADANSCRKHAKRRARVNHE